MTKKRRGTPQSGTPPRKAFFIRCRHCGEYPVSEKSVRRLLTADLQAGLDEELAAGAAGAVLSMPKCPNCAPENLDGANVQLSALWPRTD